MDKIIDKTAVIILAAGKGTRMKSDKAKVLHEIDGQPMVYYVVETAKKIAGDHVIVVVGYQKDTVVQAVMKNARPHFAVQAEQNGTGHAVMCAMPLVDPGVRNVVILCGDVPLISAETIRNLISRHDEENATVTVLAVEVENPKGYGRMITCPDGSLQKIIEEADASDEEKKIRLVNAGIYCVSKAYLAAALCRIKSNNAQNELYLTDIVEIASNDNKKIGMCIGPSSAEVIGVNTCDDLNNAQRIMSGM